jgi:hypothetical protein
LAAAALIPHTWSRSTLAIRPSAYDWDASLSGPSSTSLPSSRAWSAAVVVVNPQ